MIYPWNQGVWEALQRARVQPQALLLTGPRGVGKSAFAQALAKAILCPAHAPGTLACDRCTSCRLFDAGTHPDYRLVEPINGEAAEETADISAAPKGSSRFILISQIRELAGFVELSAHLAGHKVVIIQPADKLHPSAGNALLKTLEEPPRRTVFVLISDHPQRVSSTVRSRCFHLTFAVPEKQIALDWLHRAGIEEPEVRLAQAGYAPLAAAGMESGDYWRSRRVLLELLGRPDAPLADVISKTPTDQVGPFLAHLYRWCYDLISARLTGHLRYNLDFVTALSRGAANADVFRLLDLMNEVVSALRSQEHPLNPRLVMEQLTIRYRRSLTSENP